MRNRGKQGSAPGRRRWVLVVGGSGLVLLTAVTWLLAGQSRTPRQLAADAAAPPKSTITVPVRFETLTRTVSLECAAEPDVRWPVQVAAPEAGDPVVTALPIKRSGRVGEGSVVLEVSGRPVIVLRGRLPAYRDLAPGAVGPDVKQLQAALMRLGLLAAGTPSGAFDAHTRQAVVKLYRDRGYPAPGSAGQGSGDDQPGDDQGEKKPKKAAERVSVPRRELLMISRLPARLGTVKARVGGPAKSGAVVIEAGRPVLRCTVNEAGALQGLSKGAQASVTSPDGTSTTGAVERLSSSAASNPAPPTAGSQGGQGAPQVPDTGKVIIRVRRALKLGSGYRARIEVEKADHAGPVIPSSALWTKPGGRVVVRVLRGGKQLEVPVEPGLEVDGQIAVQSEELQEGDQVIVASQPDQAVKQ